MPQLRAALYDIHDIFFVLPLADRLALLQQDRELRAERKLRGMVLADCQETGITLNDSERVKNKVSASALLSRNFI